MNDNEIKKLYNALISKGYSTADIGDEGTFISKMSDSTNRRQFYDAFSKRGNFRLGDWDTFEKRLTSGAAPVQQEQPAQPIAETPTATPHDARMMQGPAVQRDSSPMASQADIQARLAGMPETANTDFNNEPQPELMSRKEQKALRKRSIKNAKERKERQAEELRRQFEESGARQQIEEIKQNATDYIKENRGNLGGVSDIVDENPDKYRNIVGNNVNDATNSLVSNLVFDWVNRYLGSDISAARATRRKADETLDLLDEASHDARSWWNKQIWGIGRGVEDAATRVGTWDMGMTGALDGAKLNQIVEKYDAGEELSSNEEAMLDMMGLAAAAEQAYAGQVGVGYNVGASLPESAGFMASMYLNPAGGMGRTIAGKVGERAVRKFGQGAIRKMTARAMIAGARVAGDAAEMAILTNTLGAARVAEDAFSRMNGSATFDIDENGIIRYGGQDEREAADDAIWNAIGSQFIENWSEAVGEYFNPLKKWLDRSVMKGLRRVGLDKIADAYQSIRSSQWSTSIDNFARATKFNGTLGEYLEEVIGNITNALTVGDMNFAFPGREGYDQSVFNLETNLTTLLSCALMTGTINGVKAGGTYIERGNIHRATNKAAAALDNLCHTDEEKAQWEDLRKRIDGATPSERVAILQEALTNTEANDRYRKNLIDYAVALTEEQEYNARVAAKRSEMTEEARNAMSAYDNGYHRVNMRQMNDAKSNFQYDAKSNFQYMQDKLRKAGVGEEVINAINSDPFSAVETVRQNEMGWTKEQQRTALDYIYAIQTYNGVVQRVRDDIQGRIDQSDANIDASINRSTTSVDFPEGMVQQATMKDDRKVYIVSGNVVQFEDGTGIDHAASDESIIVRDAQTGKLEQVSPSAILNLDYSVPSDILSRMSADNIRQQYGQQAVDNINGKVTFQQGQQLQWQDDNGEVHTYTVVADNGGDTITVTEDGKTPVELSRDYFQQEADAAGVQRAADFDAQNEARRQQQEAEAAAQRAPQYQANDDITIRDENGNEVRGHIHNFNADEGTYEVETETPVNGKLVQPFTADQLNAMTVTHNNAPVVQNEEEAAAVETETGTPAEIVPQTSALSQIPTDEGGNPIYEQSTPDIAWDAIVEQAGDEAIAQSVAADMLKDKKAALKKAEKAPLAAGTTVAEKIAAQKAKQQVIDAAKAEVAFWENVVATNERRAKEAEEAAKAQAEAERKAAEEAARLEAERKAAEAAATNTETKVVESSNTEGVDTSLDQTPDVVDDTPEAARTRGFRRVDGHRVDRQGAVPHLEGKEVGVKFSNKVIQNGRVAVIDASQLQPSHLQGQVNHTHFLDEAQPKDRADATSAMAAQRIAHNIRPEEITSSVTAYTGAPSVNARGEVIQGNNRADALRYMWGSEKAQGEKYRQYLIDHAAEFGLNAEEIAAMEAPVLVNMFDVDDKTAIDLGQYVAQDTESGGIERIKPKNAAQKMGNDMRLFAEQLLDSAGDEDMSFAQLLDRNAYEVLHWMNQQGYITPTQYASALDTKGNVTADAKNDLKAIMFQSIFRGANRQLEEMFNRMPAKAQKAILATAYRDYNSPSSESMIDELQDSIRAFDALMNEQLFQDAKNWKDAANAVEAWKIQYVFDDVTGDSYLPSDKFSNFALHLATMYKADTQRSIQNTFNEIYDLIQGAKEDNLFEEADKRPRTLVEAVKETLNIEYDGQRRSNVLGSETETGSEGRREIANGSEPGERTETGEQPADDSGRASGNSRKGGNDSQRKDNLSKEVDEISSDERTAMESRIVEWLSDENLNKAFGKSRDQILEEFGNEPQPIAYIPKQFLSLVDKNITDPRIYCGKGYFIDHALRNHGKAETQIAAEDVDVSKYLNIQSILDNPDSIKETFVDGKRTVVFIKKIGRYFAELTQVEEDGRIILHKSLFNQKKEPYVKLDDIRQNPQSSEGGASSISHADDAAPAISLESRDDRNGQSREESQSSGSEGHLTETPSTEGPDLVPTSDSESSSGNKGSESQSQNNAPEGKSDDDKHKIVSTATYEELKKRMREKLEQLNMGIDHEMMAIGGEMAAYHIEGGARKFVDYAKAMIADVGDAIRPYLKSFYNAVRDMPEAEEFADELTPYEEVRAFNVATIGQNGEEASPSLFDTAEQISNEETVRRDEAGMDTTVSEETESNGAYTIAPAQYTTKKGKVLDMFLVTPAAEMEKEAYKAASSLAREMKGWYDSKAKGFMLRSEEDARKFAEQTFNSPIGDTSSAEEIQAQRDATDKNPTEGQKKAGNYAKGHVKVDGHDITIENPKGSTRSGKDADGREWSVTMNYDYGYIRRTKTVDGDHIDVYLSDNPASGNVYVVDQINQNDGSFDEHKVMYGFPSLEAAREAYASQYEKGWKIGTITEVSREEFRKWIDSSYRKTKPFAEYKSVKAADTSLLSDSGTSRDEQEVRAAIGKVFENEKGDRMNILGIENGRVKLAIKSNGEVETMTSSISAMADALQRWTEVKKQEEDEKPQFHLGDFLDNIVDAELKDSDWQFLSNIFKNNPEDMARDEATKYIHNFIVEIASRDLDNKPVVQYFLGKNGAKHLSDATENIIDEVQYKAERFAQKQREKETKARKQAILDKHNAHIGDKYLYEGKEVTLYDVQEFGDNEAVIDVGLAPVLYTVVDFSKLKPLNNNSNGQSEETTEQERADSAALASEAEAVASKAESDVKAATTEGAVNETVTVIDDKVEQVNDQLAILGYYKADPNSPDHESLGHMRSAEALAVKDANNLAAKLIRDLGIDPEKIVDKKGKKVKKVAKANLAPIGGDITMHFPLTDDAELYIDVDVERQMDDSLKINGSVMYRINHLRNDGSRRFGENHWIEEDATYGEFLKAMQDIIKWEVNGFIPVEAAVESKPAAKSRKTTDKSSKNTAKETNDGEKTVSSQSQTDEDFIRSLVGKTLRRVGDNKGRPYNETMVLRIHKDGKTVIADVNTVAFGGTMYWNFKDAAKSVRDGEWSEDNTVEAGTDINPEEPITDLFGGVTDETQPEAKSEISREEEKARRTFVERVRSEMLAALDTDSKPFRSINDIRKKAAQAGMQVDNEGRSDILLQELVEDGLVRAAREIIHQNGRLSRNSFDLVCKLYEMQPTIAQRSSNRIKMQQYSTPLPMAWAANRFAMQNGSAKVLEPTAGNGMLVFTVPFDQVHANELDPTRAANLMEQGFRNVTMYDATEPFRTGKVYDAVIANPPFGSSEAKTYDGKEISGLDPQITLNALESMKNDGRAAIIIGGNNEYNPNGSIKNNKAFLTYLYDHYNVKGIIDMAGSLYAKQGTTFPTRMILIEGRRSEEEREQTVVYPPIKDRAIRKAETFDDLYDIINEVINSKDKTNGNEVLRSGSGRVSVIDRPSGNTDRVGHRGESDKNDDRRRGRSGERGLLGEQKGSQELLRGEHREDTGNGTSGRQADGNQRGGSGRTVEPDVQRVDGVGVRRSGVGLETPVEHKKRTLTEEKLPYRPHNSAFSLESVAPAAMVEAMDNILTQIEKEEGNIDEYVTRELGYSTVEEAHSALAAEQMDSVAMAIYQMKHGQALIIGDQTGVGKGRQMAALIRWGVNQGKKPIFFTQKADLFSDIYRDLVDIGSGDLVPFIFNSPSAKENKGEMVDANGNTVYKGLSDAKMKKVLASGKLPDGYDYAVLTYSQINSGDDQSQSEAKENAKKSGQRAKKSKSAGKATPKATFLRNIAKDNYLLLDESHTAAGQSNTGAYLQSLLKAAKAATFASATFAKRPDTMPMYALRTAMSQAKVEPNELINIIQKGGVTLQEIMSRELTNAGQMVRRERDMSDVKTDWKTIDDPETTKRARDNYDRTIKAFNAIIQFQDTFVKPMIEAKDKDLAEIAQTAGIKRGTNKLGVENVPFASKTYNYTKQLMLALKVDAIADEVENEIKAGRHPVIALESTMESTIKGYNPGDVIAEPTFSASLLKGLETVMQYSVKNENGKESFFKYNPSDLGPEGEKAYYDLQQFIVESTSDVYISPLDAIIDRLHEKGYKVGELTGRDLYVEKNDKGQVVVRKRTDKDKKKMQRDFNSGALDVLILNKSASTGISLHASTKFSDQRQRSMIIAQPLSDINDYMQMIGRIDRTGQVSRGYYINLDLPVPAENRFLMMLSTKLKSLNANTTTSQDNESNDVEAPDLLNKYGSQVIVEYLRDNPEIYEKLGRPFKSGAVGEKEGMPASKLDAYQPQEDDARRVTGYVALLSTKEQEDFYTDVVKRYNDLIRYLNDTGTNDLKINVMPLRAKTLSRKVSSQGLDPEGNNPFAKDSYVEEVEMDALRKPMKADEIRKVIDQINGEEGEGVHVARILETIDQETNAKIAAENERHEKAKARDMAEAAKKVAKINAQETMEEKYKRKAIDDIEVQAEEKDTERHNNNIARINGAPVHLRKALEMFVVGKTYRIPDMLDSQVFDFAAPAIFCGYKAKESKITESTTFAVFATLDGRRRVEVKLSDATALETIVNLTRMNWDATRSTTLENWDSQIPTETRKKGYIMTGNILQAIADTQDEKGGYPGQLISYTDIDGNVHDGILMPDKWSTSMLRNSGAPITSRMNEIKEYKTVVSQDGKVTIDGSRYAGMYYLTVPKTKKEGAQFFENKVIQEAAKYGEFNPYRGKLRADIPASKIEAVVKELGKLGVKVKEELHDDDSGDLYRTSEQLDAEFGKRWIEEQTNMADGRHTTQVKNTLSSYKKFADWVKKDSNGRNVSVLDASSGLGLGTQHIRENGLNAEDVEPYASSEREKPTFNSYAEINKKYDYIISNAVLNVIPDDWRADVLHNMADVLKAGGKLIINVRSAKSIEQQGTEGKSRITLDTPSEILVTRPDGSIRAYQKGFTKEELRDWARRELGEGYEVEIANNTNAGSSYDTAVVVTKTDTDVEELNNNFNENLQRQIEKELPAGFVYELGLPSAYLQSVGIERLPITLNASILNNKSNDPAHPYSLEEVKDLVKMIQKPIAIFQYGDKKDARNLMIGISQPGEEGKQFLVGLFIRPNVKGKGVLEINSIRNVFPKNYHDWIHWVNQGKMMRVDGKEEIQAIINALRINPVDYIDKKDLDSATKIIKDFENPSLPSRKSADNTRMGSTSEPRTRDTAVAKRKRVEELAKQLHLDNVVIRESVDGLEGKRRRAKGFYTRSTGKITIVFSNHSTVADVEQTVLHEAVAHYGLRRLFGKDFDTFLDNVYKNASVPVRRVIADMAIRNGWDFRTATEEYLATLAENTNFEQAQNEGWWGKIKQLFLDMLGKLGFKGLNLGFRLSDNELRYVLWRSYQNLKEGGKYDNLFNEAADITKQYGLKVGEFEGAHTGEEQAIIDEARSNGTYLKAPNGKDTKLSPRQWVQVRTGAFKRWFGDWENDPEHSSKAVDPETGEPIVVYHGTDAEFDTFEAGHGTKGLGFFFTDNKTMGGSYGKNVKGLFLNVRDPYEINGGGRNWNNLAAVIDKTTDDLLKKARMFRNNWRNYVESQPTEERRKQAQEIYGWWEDKYLKYIDLYNSIKDSKSIIDAVKRYFYAKKLSKLDFNSVITGSTRDFEKVLEKGESMIFRNITDYGKEIRNESKVPGDVFVTTDPSDIKSATDNSGDFDPDDDNTLYRDGSTEDYRRSLARAQYEQRLKTGMYQSQEALQDSMLGLRTGMAAILGQKRINIEEVAGFENAYLGENRLSSVNLDEANYAARTLFKPLFEEISKIAHNETEREDMKDYMMAKHGLERNEYMARQAFEKYQQEHPYGAKTLDDFRKKDYAGLTALTGEDDTEIAEGIARDMVDDYENSHDTTGLWEKVNAISSAILRKSYESGFMNRETYDKISSMYEYYIPLRGFDEKTSEETYAYLTSSRSAFNSPIQAARGRKSKADDPIATLQQMMESGIAQGNRNTLVKQKFLNFVLNHPSDLVSVSDLWIKKDAVTGEWVSVFPDNIEKDDPAAEVERKMREFEERMQQLAEAEPDNYKKAKDAQNIPYRVVTSRELHEHQIVVKRGGKDYILTVNGNPRLAQAINGLTNPDNDVSGAIGAILKGGEWLNRKLSSLYTTKNPDFVLSNFMRDMLYTNSMVWVKEKPNYAIRFHKNIGRVRPKVMLSLIRRYENGTLGTSDPLEVMFRQFMQNGGETGYTSIRNIEQHKKDVEKEIRKANGEMTAAKAMDYLEDKLDWFNRSVENCARFAAFVTSREMGRSIDRSIWDAKEVSVNFNKKGSGSKFMEANGQTGAGKTAAFVSGLGRSGFVFWNASVQGLANIGDAFRRNPKKAIAMAAALYALGAVIAYMGYDGDDDDDKSSYFNLPEYVRRSNIMFRPGTRTWVSIPLPIEYRAIYGMGELMVSAMSGKEHFTDGELASAIASQVTQVLPLDVMEGNGGFHALIPSSIKPITEAISNKSWTGMPLYKDTPYNQDDPDWTKAYKSANKVIVWATKGLSNLTGGDQYTKGAIDLNPAKIEYILNGYFGGVYSTIDKMVKMGETITPARDFDPRNFLLLNRIVKSGDERTEYRALRNEFFRAKEEHDKLGKRLRRYESDTDEGIFDYAEKIDFLYNSPEYARWEIFEEYKDEMKALDDMMKEYDPKSDDYKLAEADYIALMKEMTGRMDETRKRSRKAEEKELETANR